MAVQPRPISSKKKSNPLEVVTTSLLALYIKAKSYHFNVTGPSFHSDHVTYDGIAGGALDFFDLIGERMRAIDLPVCVCSAMIPNVSVVSEPIPESSQAHDMLVDMLGSLQSLSAFINSNTFDGGPTTENLLQEVDAFLGKQSYFVRSSL